MVPDFVSLGKRIKYARKKRGLSQAALAEQISCSTSYISYLESGLKCMSLETFINVANTLNTSADDLLRDSLENTVRASNHAFAELLSDCSEYELRIIRDLITTAKATMRTNRQLLMKRR